MEERYARSRAQHRRANASLAGGVSSAIRSSQQPVPITFVRGQGPCLTDLDGNEYIDYALAYGPMLLGHSPVPVIEAVRRQLSIGLGYGAQHLSESQLAEAICRTVPCADLSVFSNSGSEAVLAALRIARSATGRTKVIKFQGHFHGWPDPLAVGTPGLNEPVAASGGQDPLASASVTVCGWNDLTELEAAMGDDVAAVIMEPLAANGGCLSPAPGYLAAVRELTRRNHTLLIFDEIITGFRLALGGAQERFDVVPDLAVLGKALGGGLPISAVCGRREVMEEVASGRVAHLGTFNANPIVASAAVAAVEELERGADEIYPHLDDMGARLAETFRDAASEADLPLAINQVGATAYAFWSSEPVASYEATLRSDPATYRRFARALLDEGVHVIPRGLLYLSTAHGEAELARTKEAVHRAASAFRRERSAGTTRP